VSGEKNLAADNGQALWTPATEAAAALPIAACNSETAEVEQGPEGCMRLAVAAERRTVKPVGFED
jgi:hypothetical protein